VGVGNITLHFLLDDVNSDLFTDLVTFIQSFVILSLCPIII
jgi:hypothetical protein